MDRNGLSLPIYRQKYGVALRKESVDRNFLHPLVLIFRMVALRKESVDRNNGCKFPLSAASKSLSARRAWIEMLVRLWGGWSNTVALRKESVDRNAPVPQRTSAESGRSPQGERG